MKESHASWFIVGLMMKTATFCALLSISLPLRAAQWFEEMQFGPAWSNTFVDQYKGQRRAAALNGILVDLGERKNCAVYDTETLRWVTAYSGFVKWGGTPWTGQHGNLVTLQDDKPFFITESVCGWAAENGSFDDDRELKGMGNLPAKHGRYLGYYKNGQAIVIESEVQGTRVLETVKAGASGIERHWEIAPGSKDLVVLLADEDGAFEITGDGGMAKSAAGLQVAAGADGAKVSLQTSDNAKGRLALKIPAHQKAIRVQVVFSRDAAPKVGAFADLVALTKGGAPQYSEVLTSAGTTGEPAEGSAWAVDQIKLPGNNPWKSNLRFGGFDFLDENTAVLSSWNGDVWTVSGFNKDVTKLSWKRIASGLFETLGLKVVKGQIYVHGRDGITQLIDLNGDGEIDQFKAFNRDVIITQNFHEFAFDLQTDKEGNFYFVKASPVRGGGRGFDPIAPHHGIVAKVSADGKKFEVLATGLRAPGGMGVGPDGQITTGENEGTWQPRCKVNYFTKDQAPVFLGTEDSKQAINAGKSLHEPICYLPMSADNSGGSQVWVPAGVDFGIKAGELIHLSYGKSSIYRILPDSVGGVTQGAAVKIPVQLQSSAMRARFHTDGSLFLLGFRGWQTNAASECAFQRIRYVKEKPLLLPVSQKVTAKGVKIGFAVDLDKELAVDVKSYNVERWNYVRSVQYGSGEFSVDQPDAAAIEQATKKESHNVRVHDKVEVLSAQLSADGKTVELELKGMKPCNQLRIGYDLESAKGEKIAGELFSTVKKLP